MKVFTFFIVRKVCLVLAILLPAGISYAAVFTATASGNFSSSATWSGGLVPPTTLTTDVIVIPAGISVNLDQNLTIDGALAQLDVSGNLTTNNSSSLLMAEGTLTGTGSISLNKVDFETGTTFLFTGTMNVEDMKVEAIITSTADVVINNSINLVSGEFSTAAGGSLTVSPDTRINISGGSMTLGIGGTMDLTSAYDVKYSGNSLTSGIELTGTGLRNLEVSVDDASSLTLASDAVIDGKLNLTGGTFNLGGYDLTLYGDVESSGSGKIYSTALSDITLQAQSSTTGALNFDLSSEINNLILLYGEEYAAKIKGFLSVNGMLSLNGGTLALDDASLTINGDVTGTGSFSATPLSNMTINTEGGISTSLRFATEGQTLNDLTLAVGAASDVTLDSDLTLKGTLDLSDGSLTLSSSSLTLDATSTIEGSGKISVDPSSSLSIYSTSGISSLRLDGTIGDLTVATPEGSTVTLGSDATISGMLRLESGSVMLNDHDLTLMGDVYATGSGKVYSTAGSDISFSSSSSMAGTFTFDDGSLVKNLTVDVGSVNEAKISGDLTVENTLAITSGILTLNDASLTMKGDLTGTGFIKSTGETDLNIFSSVPLTEPLRFTADGQTVNSLTIDVDSQSVRLGSNLTVDGMLSLTDGSLLDVSGKTLILDAESNISGTGSLTVDASSALTINSTTDISALKLDGTVGALTINTGDASVKLASDATVSSTLNLMSGDLNLDKYDLSINGSVTSGGTGTLSATADSDIKIETTTSTGGALRFSATANTIGDMTVKIADGGTATIDSDVTISKSLFLDSGILDINDQKLSIDSVNAIVGGSATTYIKTDAGGYVEMQVAADGSVVTYPVGTFTAYAPVNISLASGTESGKIQVGVSGEVYADGTTGFDLSSTQSLVDATWDIKSDVQTGLDMTLQVMWPATLEVNGFDRTDAYISHYTNAEWDLSARAAATTEANGMFSLERTGITSLSPFAVFDAKTTTATDETDLSDKIRLYPVPALDQITIEGFNTSEPVTLGIYNSYGQLVDQLESRDERTTISVGDLANGNYYVRMTSGNYTATRQFTKL